MTRRLDLASHERSIADWLRLRTYARRVAANTNLRALQDSKTFHIQKTCEVPIKGVFFEQSTSERLVVSTEESP
ncbi:hypothetical protein D9M72_539550 [compost metagenome]